MSVVNFYCVNDDINNFIYMFLNKLIERDESNIMLYSNSIDKIKKFDESLWMLGNDCDFLPHLIYNEKCDNNVKLLLTNELLNVNKSDFLILSSFVDNIEFLNSFKKIFYIYTKLSNLSYEQAKKSFEFYKQLKYDVNINIKNCVTGKWVVDDCI